MPSPFLCPFLACSTFYFRLFFCTILVRAIVKLYHQFAAGGKA
ncbi:Substrate-specific component YkoE of thiamin- regulated ECF transporter for HydroxyMethylPyrimidine [Streptococcus mitis]|uniref:Substrate-specific component YkoE of thiamin-regulated ECF transporter for HydroxyMethylPyrimidine n=1 Tax=Streptococcus mitis TaxID=28037 RepID=A0A150NN78_STRMT|nr:Substrate-specific component YkoE of thiamin- regulated ECF transporter for HydroxyMethylPyrimidine [Streptococcus mitis]